MKTLGAGCVNPGPTPAELHAFQLAQQTTQSQKETLQGPWSQSRNKEDPGSAGPVGRLLASPETSLSVASTVTNIGFCP